MSRPSWMVPPGTQSTGRPDRRMRLKKACHVTAAGSSGKLPGVLLAMPDISRSSRARCELEARSRRSRGVRHTEAGNVRALQLYYRPPRYELCYGDHVRAR